MAVFRCAIGRRDRVLLALLYDTAVRVSELTGIVLGDMTLNTKNPSIIIHGKGKKTRMIVLNKKCADLVKDYVLHYHEPDALRGNGWWQYKCIRHTGE